MAEFENRQPTEGINTSANNPLLTFLKINGWLSATHQITPLPDDFHRWLDAD